MFESKRPVLYVGGGVIRAEAHKELLKLADRTGLPVLTTLMGRGAFPDSHPHHLGMPGMHGTVPAVLALQESDLIVALGARFDDRVTGKVADFAPDAKIVHVDIDPAEIGKIRHADVPIVGDLKDVLPELLDAYESVAKKAKPDTEEWWVRLNQLKANYPLGYTDDPDDGLLAPQTVIERIGQISGPEAIYAAGVGQHQMWAAQFIKYERPNAWLNSGGAGTMGYAVPAAMGAKVAQPDRLVWAIDGDGCFQMTNQEARDLHDQQHPDQGRGDQQLVARHGAAVAVAVLRRTPLVHRPRHRSHRRGGADADGSRLREAGGGVRCPRHPRHEA